MPYRRTPIVKDQIYHVFNRSIARQPIFLTNSDYQRALNVVGFYQYFRPSLRYSHYNRLPQSQKNDFLDNLKKSGQRQIEILAFCLMPTHIHFLIKESKEGGISSFMRNFQNSYAKYFNLKKERSGSLFQSMFKAVMIETDEQLIHIARYIHLNPVTAFILKDIDQLMNYPWCSFSIYIERNNSDLINKEIIMGSFSTIKNLVEFTKNQVDYQRKLDKIKHLTLE
ncbi:MAG: transposase [Candidatus Daviesbacteria bacterium]|nr:transposase [Candidatus Daviesbacteria bacterium]